MKNYMVAVTWVQGQQEAIESLIPAEQARVKELMEQGLMEALYISEDLSRVWLIMKGETEAQVQQALETLPLHPYMHTELNALR